LCKLALLAAAFIGLFWIVVSVFELGDWLPLPIAMLSIYAIINGTQAVLIAVRNAARAREIVAIIQVAEAIFRPLLILVLSYLLVRSAQNIFWAYIFVTMLLVGALFAMGMFGERSDIRSEPGRAESEQLTGKRLTSDMIAYAAPFVAFGMLGVLGSYGERLLLPRWVDWADVGSYALMSQLAMAPNLLFTSVVNQFYFPVIFQSDPGGQRKLGRSFRLYFLASILGIVGITISISVLGYRLIPMISSAAFLGHEHLLWFLGLSAGLFCIAQQLVLPGLRLNRPAVYMPAKLIHSLMLLGLAITLVPRFGIDGMGVASLLSSMSYLLATALANLWLKRNVNLH
jgi:O-antigen/teichoic acid export membrane protein